MTNRRQRRVALPKLPQLPQPPRQRQYGGLTPFPRASRSAEANRPYDPPPAGWLYSLGEWVVFWHLTRNKGWKKIGREEGETPVAVARRSFYQQVSLPALGIFVNTDETRIDFLIPLGSGSNVRAIALDPYDDFTHQSPTLDRLKRVILEQQLGVQLIWLENPRLVAGDYELIESALRGQDQSRRAHGG